MAGGVSPGRKTAATRRGGSDEGGGSAEPPSAWLGDEADEGKIAACLGCAASVAVEKMRLVIGAVGGGGDGRGGYACLLQLMEGDVLEMQVDFVWVG